MAMTTITSVKIPEHVFPHVEVNINDNTIRRYVNVAEEHCRTLCVFRSPKGPDGLQTITGGIEEFIDTYGSGSVAEYGQAFLNANALAATNATTMHCLRVTADDAKVSNIHVYMRYHIVNKRPNPETPDQFEDDLLPPVEELGDGTGMYKYNRSNDKTNIMKVYFVAKYDNDLISAKDLAKSEFCHPESKTLNQTVTTIVPNEEDDGSSEYTSQREWKEVWLFSVASLGKGTCGNALSIRLSANERLNRSTDRMNYTFDIFEGGVLKETATVSFDEAAMNRGKSLFIENVINGEDGSAGSSLITIANNDVALREIWDDYHIKVNPATRLNLETFDPFLGVDRDISYNRGYVKVYSDPSLNPEVGEPTEKIPNMDGYCVLNKVEYPDDIPEFANETDDESKVTPDVKFVSAFNFTKTSGTALYKGDDGAFTNPIVNKSKVAAAEEKVLLKIFNGYTYDDPYLGAIIKYPYDGIMSTSRYPIDFFLDANYPYNVKIALADWCQRRKHDFILYLDNGTSENMTTKSESYVTKVDMDNATEFWNVSIDAYYGKIKDPYNQRIIEVTSTYNLARNLPIHWKIHNGKHIPYAGSMYGVIDSYLPNTVFPLMDKDLDAVHMDNCIAEHINYAQINSKGDVIRGTQSSRYPEIGDANVMSNLTELNNGHIVLDIKKDCEKLLENFAYNFNENEDLIRFNRRAEVITSKYSAAQVKKISATFDRTAEEAEYGILHLYIEVVHKNLVKIAIVDIDVNRNVEE